MQSSTDGAAAAGDDGTMRSSRQLFQERIHSLLTAPMPRCLQSASLADKSHLSHFDGETTTRQASTAAPWSARSEGEDDNIHRTASPLQRQQPRRPTRSVSAGPASAPSTEPIYEQLLRKGRLQQEHREQLRQAAIEREVAQLKPAPRVRLSTPPLPVAAAAPARRLPPAGQRIEDRLLQRAKEKAAREQHAALQRQQREEEELAAIATFAPRISAHAQATKARYTEPPADRAAWRARRLAELAEVRQSAEAAELQELQDGPVINKRSARLAAERKAREGLEGVPAAEALAITEHRRRLAQWQAAEAARVARETASPAITQHAAAMHRVGDVGRRLHAEGVEAALRRLQHEVAWREAHTPFQPEVTALAAVTAPRYQRENGEGSLPADLELRLQQQQNTTQHSRSHSSGNGNVNYSGSLPRGRAETFQPTINPVSAAIAARLPETSMQRLCRPGAVHTLSSYADPAAALETSSTFSAHATPRERTQVRLDMATPVAQLYHGASPAHTGATTSTTTLTTSGAAAGAAGRVSTSSYHSAASPPVRPPPPAPLPSAVAASLDNYERRRQARLEALRREQSAQEMHECTFQPLVNARSSALVDEAVQNSYQGGDDVSVAGRRGPAAVAQRSEAWQQQRDRHLETMRQWQAERAAAAEAAMLQTTTGAAAADPSSARGRARGQGAGETGLSSRSVYGGDGRAWGVEAHLARQQLARSQRQEREDALALRGEGAAAREVSKVASASTTPRQFYRPAGDLNCGGGGGAESGGSTIRSLRPPVSASELSPSARLWASMSE